MSGKRTPFSSVPTNVFMSPYFSHSSFFSLHVLQQTPIGSRVRAVSCDSLLTNKQTHTCHSSCSPSNSTTLGLHKPLLHSIPINHIPNGIDIIRTNISIIHIIGMLPNVNSKEGNQSRRGLKRILIGTGGGFDSSCKNTTESSNGDCAYTFSIRQRDFVDGRHIVLTRPRMVSQPPPSTPLHTDTQCRNFLLHGVEASEPFLHGIL